MSALRTTDYYVIAAYLVVTALIGLYCARRKSNADELFLAGRSLGPVAVGFSLFASNMSSDTLIGLPGAAYLTGIAAANYEWMAAAVLIFTIVFVFPKLLRARMSTMPEFMESRFDVHMRRYLALTTLLLAIFLDTAGTLYAGGLVLTTLVPGVSLWMLCLVLALFTALYTASGGLRAVVYTDIMQAVVLLLGSTCMAYIMFSKFGFHWSEVKARVAVGHLSLIRPLNDPSVPWLGLLTGLPVVGFYYWTMNQTIAQRVLAARDVNAAGRGAVFASALKLLPLFIITLPGAMASVVLPGLSKADAVFPAMVTHFAPVGIAGLVLAGLIAAMMSSLSATLNSLSTLLTLDFVKPRFPQITQDQTVWVGRLFVVVLAVVAACWAPMILHFSGLWAYLQQVYAFVASPLVAIFLMGMWVPSLGPRAALRGLLCGHLLSLVFFVLYETHIVPIHFTIQGGVICLLTALMTYGWMRRLAGQDAPTERARQLVEGRRLALRGIARDIRVGAVVVIALIGIMLFCFR